MGLFKRFRRSSLVALLFVLVCSVVFTGCANERQEAFKRNMEKAVEGDPAAQVEVGNAYANGDGVDQDFMDAKGWFDKAAIQGFPEGEYSLGLMYANGDGVAKNLSLSKLWYEKAAKKGNSRAAYNMGYMYLRGDGFVKDIGQAKKWLEKSANQGEGRAQLHLGLMYKDGLGVKPDNKLAYKWLYRAKLSDAGLTHVIDSKLDELAKNLPAKELDAIKQVAEKEYDKQPKH